MESYFFKTDDQGRTFWFSSIGEFLVFIFAFLSLFGIFIAYTTFLSNITPTLQIAAPDDETLATSTATFTLSNHSRVDVTDVKVRIDFLSYYWLSSKKAPLVCSNVNSPIGDLTPQFEYIKIPSGRSHEIILSLPDLSNYLDHMRTNVKISGLNFIRFRISAKNAASGADLPILSALFEVYHYDPGFLILDTLSNPFASALKDPSNNQQVVPFSSSERFQLLLNWDVRIMNTYCAGSPNSFF